MESRTKNGRHFWWFRNTLVNVAEYDLTTDSPLVSFLAAPCFSEITTYLSAC